MLLSTAISSRRRVTLVQNCLQNGATSKSLKELGVTEDEIRALVETKIYSERVRRVEGGKS
jgi:hypothetical protein